jgi:transposase-like protein
MPTHELVPAVQSEIAAFRKVRSSIRKKFPDSIRTKVCAMAADGLGIADLSRELDIDRNVIKNWIRKERESRTLPSPLARRLRVVPQQPDTSPEIAISPVRPATISPTRRWGVALLAGPYLIELGFVIRPC